MKQAKETSMQKQEESSEKKHSSNDKEEQKEQEGEKQAMTQEGTLIEKREKEVKQDKIEQYPNMHEALINRDKKIVAEEEGMKEEE